MDSKCDLIGLQVCFNSAMKHENGVSKVVWLSPSCENLQYALRILSFSLLRLKIINIINFIKEIKHVVRASIVCWKPRQSLWEFSSRWKLSTASWVFTDLLSNSPKRSPWFSPGYEGTENMFYFSNVNDQSKSFNLCTQRVQENTSVSSRTNLATLRPKYAN